MNKQKVIVNVIAFLLAFLVVSCIKDEIDLNNISHKIYWNPKIGVPIAYGNLTIADLIESIDSAMVVKEDGDKFLSLIYTNTVLSGTAESILNINDQYFSETLLESQYNLPAFPSLDTIVLKRTNQYSFFFSQGEIIDSLLLKTGVMVFKVSSSYKYKGTLKIIVPKLIKNGKPLIINVDIDKSDGSFTSNQSFDLTGYKLQLEHPNVNDNFISYDYTARLVNSGGGVTAGDNITINVEFNTIKFSSLYGYIGQRNLLNMQSQFSIPLFRHISQPNLSFSKPLIKLRTKNSFGVPASIEIYNSRAVNNKDNQTVPLLFASGVNPFNISYPSIIGTSTRDTVIFNNNTSNLNSALAIGPNNIFYSLRCAANPAGKAKNYVTDSSKISIEMDVELPLDLHTSHVEFTDTMELDLSFIGNNSENIKSLLLRTSFENGLPVDLDLQVYMLDENFNHLDTLFNTIPPVIKSGIIDQQGKVTGTTMKDIDIRYSQTDIDKLQNVKYAIVKAGIITANGGSTFVKFYSNYTINVLFGVQTELEINEN